MKHIKVYTKRGDEGETSLIGGTRVPKNHIRINAYGTIDELNSYIGLIRDQNIDSSYFEILIQIQNDLFTIGSLLAQDPDKKLAKLPCLLDSDIENLENKIDEFEESLEPIRAFILPGGHTVVSYCHIARCVCRRAEREIIALNDKTTISPIIIKYINRLSDFLFVLSRQFSKDFNINEIPWVPRH